MVICYGTFLINKLGTSVGLLSTEAETAFGQVF